MSRTPLILAAAIGLTILPAAAQQPAVTQQTIREGSVPGRAAMATATKITATVVGIDKGTRTITLKGPEGNVLDVVADDAVKNFAQIKVGDMLVVHLVEALTLELKKTGSTVMERHDRENAMAAKPGEKPAGAAARQVTVMANVVGVDPKAKTISLKGPKGNVLVLPVQNEEHFKVVKVGDQVEAVYTEAVAISVEAAPKAGEAKK